MPNFPSNDKAARENSQKIIDWFRLLNETDWFTLQQVADGTGLTLNQVSYLCRRKYKALLVRKGRLFQLNKDYR